jgi:hypothetical protein
MQVMGMKLSCNKVELYEIWSSLHSFQLKMFLEYIMQTSNNVRIFLYCFV